MVRTRSEFCAQASASMASDEPSDNEGAALDEEVEREMWRASVELAAHGEREPGQMRAASSEVRLAESAPPLPTVAVLPPAADVVQADGAAPVPPAASPPLRLS